MKNIKESALELIGNTPMVALDRLWPGPGRMLAKCEFMNPGASIKDRTSLSMITRALKRGTLQPNGPIIEMSSGNQGCGLAVVSAVLGHSLTIAMSAGNSPQRAVMMRALGARVVLAPQVEGRPGSVTQADAIETELLAQQLVAETPGAYYVDQFNNANNCRAHEETTGPEIWRQTAGQVGAFVACVGTGGAFMGISRYLKRQNPGIVCVVAEPAGAQTIKGLAIAEPRHLLQGSGYGVVPNLFTYDTMDGTVSVTDDEAVKYRDLLARKEGLYVGYTSGANVAAAVKLLESGQVPADAWVVTLLNDTGLKYPDQTRKEYVGYTSGAYVAAAVKMFESKKVNGWSLY
ncbi:unnamed protein product [Medioppia subpectinata]|uniref:Tryptophan synthase beta chain-like PALP domain-containing protein n=1 Tax=Medioppia subpectinata TaxID=1979941 RepID=A0A7R9PYI4_9ACAR|nr:unnamed protein product [Medioppia subpectinata]CAG2105442.1 unnamed protein product [Medioppia subpectinata]